VRQRERLIQIVEIIESRTQKRANPDYFKVEKLTIAAPPGRQAEK
jgi:hypothetical protein